MGEEDFLLTDTELQHLQRKVGKAVDRWNDSTRPIDHPTRINNIDLGSEFDERAIFDRLVEINGVGEDNAISILEKLVILSFDEISKDDISQINRITEKTQRQFGCISVDIMTGK